MKVLYKKKEGGSADDTVAEDQADLELEKITKLQSDYDVDSKAQEQELIHALSSNKLIPANEISDRYCSSIMLNPSDIKLVLNNHNNLISQIESFEAQNVKHKEEIEELKVTLSKELQKEQPNIKEITDRIVE